MGPALFDYNMRLIQLSVIQLSGGHCIQFWQSLIVIMSFHSRCTLMKLLFKELLIGNDEVEDHS